MTERPTHLRVRSIAEKLGVSVRTVRRWIADGTLPSTRIGGARLVATADLERLLGSASESASDPIDAEDSL